MRVGIVNRFTPVKRRRYPLGLALERIGATYLPLDVRSVTASLAHDGAARVAIEGEDLDDLKLDGVVWRVSEGDFHAFADVHRLIAQRCPVVNDWRCTRTCANKWRTSVELAAAGIRVVPTSLLTPGMPVPEFPGFDTVIKPVVGARGRGVRWAEPGTDPGITEPHVAQPLLRVSVLDQVRALVCGFDTTLAMFRVPDAPNHPGEVRVNNLEAGGTPLPARAEPVRDIAVAAARCLGGELLGVDLVTWDGQWAVLEVNSAPGLDGIARVCDVDCYRIAAQAVLDRFGKPHGG